MPTKRAMRTWWLLVVYPISTQVGLGLGFVLCFTLVALPPGLQGFFSLFMRLLKCGGGTKPSPHVFRPTGVTATYPLLLQ